MNISPITFGKAIKINTSKEVAEKILANRNNSKNEIQDSFLNISIGKEANEDSVVFQLKENDSYIFTGADALAARGTVGQAKDNPFFYNMFLGCAYEATDEKGELTVLKYKESDENVTLKKAKYTDHHGNELSFSIKG